MKCYSAPTAHPNVTNSKYKIKIIEKFDEKLAKIKEYLKNSNYSIMNSTNSEFKSEIIKSIFMNGDETEKLLEDNEENLHYLIDLLNIISPILCQESLKKPST